MSQKNRIDMKSPKAKAITSYIYKIAAIALDKTLKIEKCVCPIYHTIKKPTKPEQIASGVFVCINEQYFIFSASHVFDEIGIFQLLMAVEGEEILITFGGERFSSARGVSGTHRDDPIDASVFHIQTLVPQSVKNIALNLDDLDTEPYDKTHSAFVMSGIRSKNSKTSGDQTFSKRESFCSFELPDQDYVSLDMTKDCHLVLAYDDEHYVDGQWQKSPVPAGFSGGGIFRIEGLSANPFSLRGPTLTPLLSAITIEHRRGKNNNPGILIATRIDVHLGLIDKYLPDLF